MPLDFPSSPTVGQQYLNWTWNGVAWVVTPGPPLASLAQSSQNAGRNYLDNALFNVQQRGVGPFTVGYSADRWQISFSADSPHVNMVAIVDAQRAQIGDEAATWSLQNNFTGTSGATAFNLVNQKIEKISRLSGKTITVSFFAQGASAGLRLGVSPTQNFGTGGSPSAINNINGQSVALSTAFARYSVTFNLPSDAGQTFGTNGDDFTQINFWFSAGSSNAAISGNVGVQTGIIALWGVQVEIGTQATPLEKPNPQQDLARCQRFYQALPPAAAVSIGGAPSTGIYLPVYFATTMRATPSVTVSLSGGAGYTGGSAVNQSPISFVVNLSATGSPWAANLYWTASADL